MTKKEYFVEIKNYVADNAELVAFCDKQIELLSKKRSSVNSKAKAETEARSLAVFEALEKAGKPVTVTELIAGADGEVADYTNQRVSALLNKMVDTKVKKEVVKGKAFFSVA